MDFAEAQEKVKTLSKKPSNDQLLDLYSLFKQGSQGDCAGKRPGMLDPVGRAKYDAWKKLTGTSQDDARSRYVALVEKLLSADGK
ncbi:MAG: acyl-CoA-binding protein [Deltaproteobacteria bacterium]|nr:acyl-CoA-binding protein [Deltaproteobacteria bacterium]